MKVKAFLYFPEEEIAFQRLNANPANYENIVKELFVIKSTLKTTRYQICYDPQNVSSFIDVADGLIENHYLRKIKGQLQYLLKNSINIRNQNMQDANSVYANWSINISADLSPFVIAESAESFDRDNDMEKTVCICIGNSVDSSRGKLHIIKDAVTDTSLPSITHVPIVINDTDFSEWQNSLFKDRFSLKNNKDFEPLDRFWGKSRIYRHRASGEHWYFDIFHKENKIHFEVFDNTGDIHKGEANSEGKLQSHTSDESKKISRIL